MDSWADKMHTQTKTTFLEIILALLALLLLINPASAQETENPSLVPLNPHFVEYLDQKAALSNNQQELSVQELSGNEHSLGYIPEPIDMSHLQGQQLTAAITQL